MVTVFHPAGAQQGGGGGKEGLSVSHLHPQTPGGFIIPDFSPAPPASRTISLSACFVPYSLSCVLGSLIIMTLLIDDGTEV